MAKTCLAFLPRLITGHVVSYCGLLRTELRGKEAISWTSALKERIRKKSCVLFSQVPVEK